MGGALGQGAKRHRERKRNVKTTLQVAIERNGNGIITTVVKEQRFRQNSFLIFASLARCMMPRMLDPRGRTICTVRPFLPALASNPAR